MYAVCKTDVGRMRSNNQDACACGVFSEDAAWSVMCDGMGGVNGGNIASTVARDTIVEILEKTYVPEMAEEAVRAMMLDAVSAANVAVIQRSEEEPALHGMGTTVVVVVVCGGTLHVVHAGDSRCYLKNTLGVKQITRDHSFVQQLVENGVITDEEARVHPQRNLITRVVGVHQDMEYDYAAFRFEPGDLALSCTDGLSNYLERDTLLFFISNYAGEKLAEELIRFANEKGGSDNISVAIIENR